MNTKLADAISLNALLKPWHNTHHEGQKMYYLASTTMTDDAIEMIERAGYEFSDSPDLAFYISIPAEDESLITKLTNTFGNSIAIIHSDDL